MITKLENMVEKENPGVGSLRLSTRDNAPAWGILDDFEVKKYVLWPESFQILLEHQM